MSGTPTSGVRPWPTRPVPIVVAPMAGGPSTPELAAAVSGAGGLGFLAAGYQPATQVSEQIRRVHELTDEPIGVNVFVPGPDIDEGARRAQQTAVDAYIDLLRGEAMRVGVELPQVRWDDTDDWDAKIDALVADPVDVVSFTFGTPSTDVVEALHAVGSCVAVTVTDVTEAQAATEVGADTLIVQGCEAGGHRGTHEVAATPNGLDHVELLRLLADSPLDLVAAGGITTGGDTRRALEHGAIAVQAGTAFLLADEAGTNAVHRTEIRAGRLEPTITRAFSGRPARGLRNRFVETFDDYAPSVFPAVDQLTKPLRARAAALRDSGGMSLWVGAGWRASAALPAAAITRRLTA